LELVAQGMVIQSVAQVVPTRLPTAGLPPLTLNDIDGMFTEETVFEYSVHQSLGPIKNINYFKF
jgi:hypothetical protein